MVYAIYHKSICDAIRLADVSDGHLGSIFEACSSSVNFQDQGF